jgi:hypothetical protein
MDFNFAWKFYSTIHYVNLQPSNISMLRKYFTKGSAYTEEYSKKQNLKVCTDKIKFFAFTGKTPIKVKTHN